MIVSGFADKVQLGGLALRLFCVRVKVTDGDPDAGPILMCPMRSSVGESFAVNEKFTVLLPKVLAVGSVIFSQSGLSEVGCHGHLLPLGVTLKEDGAAADPRTLLPGSKLNEHGLTETVALAVPVPPAFLPSRA